MAQVRVGLLVILEAKPGKEQEVESFLKGGLALVEQEPATTTWYGIRLGPSKFGIFDTFSRRGGAARTPFRASGGSAHGESN